jgi:hypothetical protein
LTKAAVGFEMKLWLRIEVGGAKPVPPDVLVKLNAILAEVGKELRLQ